MKASIIILSAFLLPFLTGKKKRNEIPQQQLELLSETIKTFPDTTEFSVAFIKNNNVSYVGLKCFNDTLEYIDNAEKVYEIGSITKVFTSTLLANFVLDNRINLNDPIENFFSFPIQPNEIKVVQLANHSSGLPRIPSNLNLSEVDFNNPYKDYSRDKLKEYLSAELKYDSLIGGTYQYSNLGAGLLGYLLEIKSDSSYENLLQKHIASKYGMMRTTTDMNKVMDDLIKGRDSLGNPTSNWNLNALVGAGGIYSNVKDLAKFTQAHFNIKNRELNLTQKSTFSIPEYGMDVGLAWNIIEPIPGKTWHMHNGGTGGYTSILAMDTTSKTGVIILTNVSAFHPQARSIDLLCIELMKSLYSN